jgi:hypothetical protein
MLQDNDGEFILLRYYGRVDTGSDYKIQKGELLYTILEGIWTKGSLRSRSLSIGLLFGRGNKATKTIGWRSEREQQERS